MPYEGEFAPRLGHVPTASNPAVEAAMQQWDIPAFTADPSLIKSKIIDVGTLVQAARAQTRFAFAFDGSDLEIPARAEYPSVTVGFIQIAGALVDLDQFFASYDRNLVDPRLLRKAMDARSIQSVLPGSMVVRPGMSGVDTWRYELNEMFLNTGFTEAGTMYSLQRALMTLHGEPGVPAPSLTLGRCPECSKKDVQVQATGSACPDCKAPLYVTDILRSHEEFAESGSNIVPFTRVMNSAERLLSLGYIDWLYANYPASLATTLFIQDGPLAFHGTTAPLKRRWLDYWRNLTTGLAAKGLLPPLVVGIEKSGTFVEHANAIASHIPAGHLLPLDNDYIQRRIRARPPTTVYGEDEFYGRRYIYKTTRDRPLVLTVPRVPAGEPYEADAPPGVNASADPLNYGTLRVTLEVLDRIQTRLYSNAVIPVALAHETAALPLGTGSQVLTLMAKKALGLP
jgi:hypothetical protein